MFLFQSSIHHYIISHEILFTRGCICIGRDNILKFWCKWVSEESGFIIGKYRTLIGFYFMMNPLSYLWILNHSLCLILSRQCHSNKYNSNWKHSMNPVWCCRIRSIFCSRFLWASQLGKLMSCWWHCWNLRRRCCWILLAMLLVKIMQSRINCFLISFGPSPTARTFVPDPNWPLSLYPKHLTDESTKITHHVVSSWLLISPMILFQA